MKALSPTIQEFDSIIRYDIKEAVKSGKATIRMKLLNKMILPSTILFPIAIYLNLLCHVIVPKQFNEKVRNLRGKQVKIILDDEL